MKKNLIIYHGSPSMVQQPALGLGNPHNDYGQGFYCTQDFSLACEWACKRKTNGFANEYTLVTSKLALLDLLDGNYTVLHWIALLLANRDFSLDSELAEETRAMLLENYLIDTSPFDIVVGYRADDAYFSFAESFVEGTLSLAGLQRALYLGNLGEQIVLVSPAAFEALHFETAHRALASTYYPKFIARDTQARSTYHKSVAPAARRSEGLFALDLLRMGKEEANARVQRITR